MIRRVLLGVVVFFILFRPEALLCAWGKRGMVASEHVLASRAGVEVLKRGGNAVDAAVATAFALGVVNPSSCGLGGGAFMLIHLARTGTTYALDARETAPAAAAPDMFASAGEAAEGPGRQGPLSVAVPGEVAGLTAAHERFGALSLSEVMEPAIRLAREGFPVGAHLAEVIAGQARLIREHPALARTFLGPDGSPYREGQRLSRPDLAASLALISRRGGAAFYRGPIGMALVKTMEREGGLITAADLEAYRPVWRNPLVARFKGHTVLTMPPPGSGGVLIETLNILSSDRLEDLSQGSPTYLHLLAEAMKQAFADRAAHYGDPGFTAVPLDTLLSGPYAHAARQRISAVRTRAQAEYGRFATAAGRGTSHVSVVDSAGNAVACTTTINTAFGAKMVVEGTGVILNNEMDDFSARPGVPNVFGLVGSRANEIAPGKRPLSSMTPTIVLRGGHPRAILGGSGGPLITSGTLQVLLSVLVFGHDATTAVSQPRIHHQWEPDVLRIEPGFGPGTREAMARRGHRTRGLSGGAAVQAVLVTAGGFQGASDTRKGGEAVGW